MVDNDGNRMEVDWQKIAFGLQFDKETFSTRDHSSRL